ncbi:MAG TPA: acyl-CoA dehydrogenase family protein [Candidatus Dormibacteraeota bacterium]|jgi:alkylation response protein AidB-like acyl-CoA dehydrogenase
MGDSIDRAYVDLVRRLVEEEDFFGRAQRNDLERRYPAENIAALKAVGVPGMAVACRHGGPGHTVATQTKVIEDISYGDPSTAACVNMHWVVADIIHEHADELPAQAALLRDCVQRGAMFAGGAAIPADVLDASRCGARFRRVRGGWLGSGRVGFATNSEGASYVGTIAAVVGEDDEPVGRNILVLNPPLDTPGIRVIRDWDAMGLRGSATHTILIENAFVGPEHAFEVDLDTLRNSTRAAGRAASVSVRRARSQIAKGGMWLGHCRRIRDLLTALLRQRRGSGSVAVRGTPQGSRAEAAWAQAELGNLVHWVDSGRLVLYASVAEIEDRNLDPVVRAQRLLTTMYHMRRMCEEVATSTFRLAGAHGFVAARPIERTYRDLMGFVATSYKAPDLVENIGRAALGLPFVLNAAGG